MLLTHVRGKLQLLRTSLIGLNLQVFRNPLECDEVEALLAVLEETTGRDGQ